MEIVRSRYIKWLEVSKAEEGFRMLYATYTRADKTSFEWKFFVKNSALAQFLSTKVKEGHNIYIAPFAKPQLVKCNSEVYENLASNKPQTQEIKALNNWA